MQHNSAKREPKKDKVSTQSIRKMQTMAPEARMEPPSSFRSPCVSIGSLEYENEDVKELPNSKQQHFDSKRNSDQPPKSLKFSFGNPHFPSIGISKADGTPVNESKLEARPTADDPNAWRQSEDPLKLYQLDKYLRIGNIVDEEVAELTRWKQADAKGLRKTYYNKQVGCGTDLIMIPVEQSRLEKLQSYEDRWPMIGCRKAFMKAAILINMAAIKVASHKAFETTSIIIILLNCVQLASEDTTTTEIHPAVEIIDYAFLGAYTLEMIIKILAKGFIFNQGAYLRDSFNILDFTIVMSAYLTIFQTVFASEEVGSGEEQGVSLNALRAFRVLRPLRSITAIKGLRILVQSLLAALPLLKDTIVVLFFFLLIFAIAGIQLISGNLKYRCIDIMTGKMVIDEDVGLSLNLSDGGILCGDYKCPAGPYYCGKMNANPDNGVTNYDNILWAVMNTFQNITLEGWSDTMKYYQMTSGIVIIVFFISSVFIGAFFLLNLTLAVINSSFSRMNEKYQKQAQEEREKRRKLMQDGAPKKKDDDEELWEEEQEDAGEQFKVQIGLHEYYVAKRALRKMLDFYKKKKEEKKRLSEEQERERQRREEEEAEILRQAAKVGERSPRTPSRKIFPIIPKHLDLDEDKLINSAEMSTLRRIKLEEYRKREEERQASQMPTPSPSPKSSGINGKPRKLQNFAEGFKNYKTQNSPRIPKDKIHATIPEEDSSNSENMEKLQQQVDEFLASIESDKNHTLDKNDTLKTDRKDRKVNIKPMLAPEIQISKLKGFIESVEQPLHLVNTNRSGRDSINFLEDLALDKFIAEEHLQPQNVQVTKKPSDENKNSGSQISVQSWEVPHYLSDFEARKVDHNFIKSEEEESAIMSDESLNKEIAILEAEAVKAMEQRKWYGPAQKRKDEFKKARRRYRKERSVELNEKTKQNDTTLKSTYYQEHSRDLLRKPKKRKTSNLISDEQRKNGDGKGKIGRTESELKRKEMIENYKNIDEIFTSKKKPKDPYEYIDRKKKKIDINPGVKYTSTSVHEVLETRQFNRANKKDGKSIKQRTNRFLKSANEKENEILYEDDYIEPLFDAYQLKTRYDIKDVEQIEFDSDDEDNLILAIQPYDTIQNVGYNNFLAHLPIKFLTRRSDILVSSTMSITLTPIDGDQQPTNTNEMAENNEELTKWVNNRQEFRSFSVQQAKSYGDDNNCFSPIQTVYTPMSNQEDPFSDDEPSTYRRSLTKEKDSGRSFTQLVDAKDRGKQIEDRAALLAKRRLPPGGLSEPLKPEEIVLLKEDQKLLYSKWRVKHESALRGLKERAKRGVQVDYTLEDANKMMEGTYHQDNEDEDDEKKVAMTKGKDDKSDEHFKTTHFLNRSNLKSDLDLAGFEKILQQVLQDEVEDEQKHRDEQFEAQIKKDTVADELRKEFDLPDNITGRKIDFNEVRRSDSARKRKTPIWSGQDVLHISFNRDHSEVVTTTMSKLRVWPKGFVGVLKRARYLIKSFIMHDVMDNFMTFAVLVNTVVMAMDRYGVSEEEERITSKISQFFTYLFIAEFGLKIIAIGPKKYVDNRMNLLDGTVVMLSLFELAMGSGGGGALSAFRSVRVFRTFRVLRVARILRSLQSMQNIIAVISRSASSFAYIAVLLMIFLFIFALLGKQIFAGKFNFEDGTPRGNYDSFNAAFLTSFITLTMENWNSLLYDAIRAKVMKALSCLYYISWIFIGNFILLNLFLAILLDSFIEEDNNELSSEEALAAQKATETLQKLKIKQEKERRMKKLGSTILPMNEQVHKLDKPKNNFSTLTKKVVEVDELIDDIDDLDQNQLRNYLVELQYVKLNKDELKPITFADAEIECQNALYLFSQQNRFRILLLRFMKSKFFDNFVMGLIVLSSIKLASDSYIVQQVKSGKGVAYMVSYYSDLFFTIMFTVEMVTKIISMGLLMDSGSYLRESWNQLDFFIVLTSLIDLALTDKKVGFIKVIRILRILRPLRFISHNQSMKMIVAALLDSGGSMLNVIIVIMIVWLMFAILAINLFSGKFFYCSEDSYLLHSKADCINAGYEWKRFNTNFDSVPQAMKALFIISTLEAWPDIMYQAVDATGVDQGPKFENQIYFGYFFVFFILIGVFFFMNFLIGVLFLKYTQAQQEENKKFTQEHLNWIDIQKMIEKAQVSHEHRYKPRGPGSEWRLKVWKIVNSDWFQNFVMAAILLNMIQMACAFDGMPAYWQKSLKISNYVFSAIFLVEAILKLYVYRKAYFYTTWNKFDFFVVSASILDVGMDMISGQKLKALSVAPQLARVLRVLRVSRVLRLAGKNEGLQALLMTIQMSVSSLLNVTALLMLIFFMFSVLGVSLFQKVTESDDSFTLYNIDPQYKNFSVFHMGFILIFVLSTGENWPAAMYDLGNTNEKTCKTTCGSSWSTLYFFTFVMVVQNIMLNLFILVIIQQFEQYYVSEDNPIQKFKNNLVLFEKIWIEFTESTHNVKIKEKDLARFFRNLPLPIGFPDDVLEEDMHKQLLKLGIRSDGGFIYFNELLYRCMRRLYGNFKLNRAMTIFEISTQFRLLGMRQNQDSQSKDQKLMMERLSRAAHAYNPFLLQMFMKMSFEKWQSMARKEMEHRQRCIQLSAEAVAEGREFKPSEVEKDNDDTMVPVQIEFEEEILITSDEEDSDDSELQEDSFSRSDSRNRASGKRKFEQDPSDFHTHTQNHIARALLHRMDMTKKQSIFLPRLALIKQEKSQLSPDKPSEYHRSPTKNDQHLNTLQTLGLNEKFTRQQTLKPTKKLTGEQVYERKETGDSQSKSFNLKGNIIKFDD